MAKPKPMHKKTGDSSLASLQKALKAETGPDRQLDHTIAVLLSDETKTPEDAPSYTSSVDACIALIQSVVPNAHWHVGYGPMGVEPYAFVSDGEARWDASAPTVPLALLTSLVNARLSNELPKSRGKQPPKGANPNH